MGEKEERINKLAKSLRQTGFSSSDSSALEKAREMVEIEERIKKSQEDKDIFGKSDKKISHKQDEKLPVKEKYDLNGITKDEKTVNEIMKEAGADEKKEDIKEETGEGEKLEETEKAEDTEERGERINID